MSDLLWKAALTASMSPPLVQLLLGSGGGQRAPSIPLSIADRAMHVDAYVIDARVSIALVSAWIVIAACGVGALIRSHLIFRSSLAARRPLTPAEAGAIGNTVAAAHEITVSSAIEVPIALAHGICLPLRALRDLSQSELQAVVAHEAAHISRGDAQWRWVSSIITRVLFFQPLNFLARNKLRELSECLCDDAAVAQTRSATDLATALASFAAAVVKAQQQTLAPSLTSRESLTLRRVRRILEPSRSRERWRIFGKFPLVTLMVCLSVLSLGTPRIVPDSEPTDHYVVTATDPAGAFTLTLHRGRVVGATIDGHSVPNDRLIQVGAKLRVVAGPSPFTIEIKPGGGIAWLPRPATPSHL